MGQKIEDDVQQLIHDSVVYRDTTSEINPIDEIQSGSLNKHRFESRGIIIVIMSTLIASVLLLSFAYIQVNLTSSEIFRVRKSTRITYFPPPGESLNSTWTTSYVLPTEIPLLEIHAKGFNFGSDCPQDKFALVVHVEIELSKAESWIERCGAGVLFFRMNSDTLEEADVKRIVNYVPNAQYIPVKAEYHGVKDSYDLLSDSDFIEMVNKESNIITSLRLSGYISANNVKAFVDLIPFVEELIIDGPELCTSLSKQLRVSQSDCSISWNELRSLKISVGGHCEKTFEFIDMCFDMINLKRLSVGNTHLNSISVRYVEDIIDKYRVMDVNFERNICADDVLESGAALYMCWKFCKD